MSYQACVHHLSKGHFLLKCSVDALDLRDAENVVIARAALTSKEHPREMDVRHLHQCTERRSLNKA